MKFKTLLILAHLIILSIQPVWSKESRDKACTLDPCKQSVIKAHKEIYSITPATYVKSTKTIDKILQELYGDYWLKVYVQHDRNYCALAKRIDVTLYGKSTLVCYQ